MAGDWAPKAQQWLHTHAGVLPISTLESFGLKRRDAYRLVETDDYELIMPGILRSTHWPLGQDQLMMAACWRSGAAMVAGLTAARLWKYRSLPGDDGEVHMLIPHAHTIALPGVVLQRSRQIDPVDIVHRDDGVRLTSPPRTLFDCADILGTRRTTSIFEQVIDVRMVTYVTLAATVARLGKPGRPGTRTMSAVAASRPAWRSGLQSELEVIVLREITARKLPTPVTQLPFILPNGERIRLDFAWPQFQVVLEVDHPFWHAGGIESHRDKRRDLKMATVGWQTVRITDLDVKHGLPASIGDVARTLAARRLAG